MNHLEILLKLAKEARACLESDGIEAPHVCLNERVQQLRLDLDWIAGTIENHLQETENPSAVTCAMAYERPPNGSLPNVS